MTEIEKELKKTRATDKVSEEVNELVQVTKTSLTSAMIYESVRKNYPGLFPDDSIFVKGEWGDKPNIVTQRPVVQ